MGNKYWHFGRVLAVAPKGDRFMAAEHFAGKVLRQFGGHDFATEGEAQAWLDRVAANFELVRELQPGELLPCPFCRGAARVDVDATMGHMVSCSGFGSIPCYIRAFTAHRERRSDAIREWNTRAGDAAALLAFAMERQRQIVVKGHSTEHDDRHTDGSLADCAGLIALGEAWQDQRADRVLRKYSADRKRQLAIAGALLIAEYERLDRAETRIREAFTDSESSTESPVSLPG